MYTLYIYYLDGSKELSNQGTQTDILRNYANGPCCGFELSHAHKITAKNYWRENI